MRIAAVLRSSVRLAAALINMEAGVVMFNHRPICYVRAPPLLWKRGFDGEFSGRKRNVEALSGLSMNWNKELTYWITPKSGPIRSLETLLDANHAVSQDLPRTFLKRPHWLAAGAFLVQAAETGSDKDIQRATDGLLRAIELEGWMSRVQAAAPSIAGQHLAAEATEVTTEAGCAKTWIGLS